MANKISKIVLWVLIAIALVVCGFFYLGGNVDETVEYVEPIYTWMMVDLMYVFVALGVLAALIMVAVDFIIQFKADRKKALVSTLGVAGFLAFILIVYAVSPGTEIEILGMDEVPSHTLFKLVDAQLYLMYIMTGVSLLLMIFGNFAKKIK